METLLSKGVSVIIIKDVPDHQKAPQTVVLNALRRGTDLRTLGVSLQEHYELQAIADTALTSLARDRVLVLDPAPYLTDAEGRCRLILDGDCLYEDGDHITVAGARRLWPMFEQAFDRLGLSSDENDSAKTGEALSQ